MDDLAHKLRQCLQQHLMLPADEPIDLSMELVALGLDSMNGIALLLELEAAFGITFPDDKLGPRTFRTGTTLLETIVSLKGTPRG